MDDDTSDAQPPKLFTSEQPQTMPPPTADVDVTKAATSNAGLLQDPAAGHNDAQQTQQ